MKPETAELVRYRLARAHESLAEARLLLANDHVRTAVNRAYYACFYAVSALLFDSRQKGDYVDLVTFDRKEVNAWVHEAGRFVEQLARSVEGLSH